MGLVIKDNDKGKRLLKALQKPSRKTKVNGTIPDGLELIERLERKLARLQAKITELETTNQNMIKRIFEIEAKVANLERFLPDE